MKLPLKTTVLAIVFFALTSCDVPAIQETSAEAEALSQIALALGAILLVTTAILLTAAALFLARSPVLAGIVCGQFAGIVMLLTMSSGAQLMIVGGLLGISLDKATMKAKAESPSTVIDRVADMVDETAKSIQLVSRQVGERTSILAVRRGVWSCVASLLLFLIVGKIGATLSIGGGSFLRAVGL